MSDEKRSMADAMAPVFKQESDLKEFRRLLKHYFPRMCSRDKEGKVRKVMAADVLAFMTWEEYDIYNEDKQHALVEKTSSD